jgi:alpha-beta hydrolase superfamily lysophospholipase
LIGFVTAGVVAAGGLVALDRLANEVVRPTPGEPDRSVPELDVDHEDFTIRSGPHHLASWLLRPTEPALDAPLLLLAHGWGASYGTVLRLAEPLVRSGHEVLLFDARGHGRNAPAAFVTVRHFRDDVMAVVRYAEERFPGRPLVLIGHSLGGAAAVLAAAEGARADGLILIATPSDVLRITSEYLTDKGMPGRLMVVALRPFWWRRIGGSFRPHVPARRIPELRVPLLIIQPENDQRVGRDHAERLASAAGVPYQLIPGRGHTDVLEAPMTTRLIEEFVAGLSTSGGV